MISEFDKAHMAEILRGEGSWFTAHLLRLIAKADQENRERIRKGFPLEIAVFEDWFHGRGDYSGNENDR